MLSGATASACATAGTAVFRIVVSSDSMKKATATSHGNNRFTDSPGAAGGTETALEWVGIMLPPADYWVVPHFQFRIAGCYLFNAETQRPQSATLSNAALQSLLAKLPFAADRMATPNRQKKPNDSRL